MSQDFDSQSSFERWKTLIEEGNNAYAQRRYTAAEMAYSEALKQAESWPSDAPAPLGVELKSRLSKSLNNMAALYHTQGKYKMSEDLYLKSLDLKKKIYGDEHDEVAVALQNLASLYSAKGDFPQAEVFFKDSIRVRENVLGTDHPDLAKILQKYALLLRKLGREQESEQMESRAMKILSESSV